MNRDALTPSIRVSKNEHLSSQKLSESLIDVFSVLVATVGALLPQFRHPLDHEYIHMWKGGRCSAAFVMLEYVHSESVLSNVTCAVLSKDFG